MCVLQFSGWLSVKIPFIACAKFPVSFACAMDSKIRIPSSIASVRQSTSKFKLFSGLDGALIATMYEKQKVFVCMRQRITNFYEQTT